MTETMTRVELPKAEWPCKSSPWGAIQDCYGYGEGTWFVMTAGHGGVKLDRKRNAMVPDYMRRAGGWYEEDCEWAIPALVFPDSGLNTGSAAKTLMDYFPHSYAKFFNVHIKTLAGKSYAYDRELFNTEHASDWVSIAASGDHAIGVPKGMVGVTLTIGGKRGSVEEKHILVSKEEYQARNHFGYVAIGDHESWVVEPGQRHHNPKPKN